MHDETTATAARRGATDQRPSLTDGVLRVAAKAGRISEQVLEEALDIALAGGPDALRPGWLGSRACRGPVDGWFPGRGEPVAEQLRTCGGCPVQAPCLSAALVNGERDGIWGGTTGSSRRKLRRELRKGGVLGVVGEDAYVAWHEGGTDHEPAPDRPSRPDGLPELWAHQRAAVTAVVNALRGGGRCQVTLATASGKTRVASEAAAELAAERVLVLLPSLPLLAQTAEEWAAHPVWQRARRLAVCSDTGELDLEATTRADDVRAFLEPPGPALLFATYQSSDVLVAAGISVDLAVADEAHHLAGEPGKPFAAIVRGDIDAARVLFMTATARVRPRRDCEPNFVGMDDTRSFGPRVFEYTLPEAIAAGIVADYRVVVAAVERDVLDRVSRHPELASVDPHLLAGAIAVVRAMGDFRLRGCLSFHTRVDRARDFARLIGPVAEALPSLRPAGPGWAGWLHGATSVRIRRRLLARLADERTWGVVANAKVLGEGVDVPALDAVAIVDPKNEERDVLQAVGRALRIAPSKSVGTVLLPVLVGEGLQSENSDDPLCGVDPRSLEIAVGVLRALRAHDTDLGSRLDTARRGVGRGGSGVGNPDLAAHLRKRAAAALLRSRVELWLPDGATGDLAGAMALHLIRESTSSWEEAFGRLERWVAERGSARVPQSEGKVPDATGTFSLGAWCTVQRTLRRRGLLSHDREARLSALPGWRWDPREERWWEQFDALADYVRVHNHFPPQSRGRYQLLWKGEKVGQFVNESRNGYRENGWLSKFPDRVAALESLPGWVWNAQDAEWELHFSQLQRWVAMFGHADPRSGDMVDGFDIGKWVAKQRSRIAGKSYVDHRRGGVMRKESLSPERTARLRALPGWVDNTREAMWETGYRRLVDYVGTNGGLPAQKLVLDDGFTIGGWVATQRERYRRGRLSRERVSKLQEIPGWTWDPLADAWRRAFDILRRFADSHPPARGLLRIPVERVEAFDLNAWATSQRRDHAAGRLAQDRVELLEAVPGWTWNTAEAKFARGLDALRCFVGREGHFDPPSAHREAGVSLRAWVYGVRSQYARGALAPERSEQLEAIDGWTWEPVNTAESGWNAKWESGLARVSRWLAAHDAKTLRSDLVVDGFALGRWAAKQRARYAAGTLRPDRVERLNQLKGWQWTLNEPADVLVS